MPAGKWHWVKSNTELVSRFLVLSTLCSQILFIQNAGSWSHDVWIKHSWEQTKALFMDTLRGSSELFILNIIYITFLLKDITNPSFDVKK